MNAAKQAAWLFFALIALACSGWYFASSSPVAIKLDDKTLSTTADAIITDLTVRQFDTNGQLANRLETPLLAHIPKNNTHLLTSPHIILAQANDQPAWDIRSSYAKAIYGGEQITFIRNVVIHQEKGQKTQESTLKTEELTYFPKKKMASTLAEVTFTQPGSVVTSKGMKAYLDEKRVQLLSQARGKYVPHQG